MKLIFFTQKISGEDFLFLKSPLKEKSFNTTFKMEALLINAYTRLDKKSKLFETNSVAIETKELLQKKCTSKNVFFYKIAF